MSVMIWDSSAQAFAEPQNVPRRYDAGSGAYVDTEGRAYDAEVEAWAEKWSPVKQLYLYKDGDECVDVTGGWNAYPYRVNGHNTGKTPTLNKGTNAMTISLNNELSGNPDAKRGCIFSEKKIDMSRFKTLKIHLIKAHAVGTRPNDQSGTYDSIYFSITDQKSDRYKVRKSDLLIINEDKEDFVASMDLTGIYEPYYVSIDILVLNVGGINVYATIDKIWLE